MLSGIEVAHSWSEELTLQICFAYFSDYFVKQREKKNVHDQTLREGLLFSQNIHILRPIEMHWIKNSN